MLSVMSRYVIRGGRPLAGTIAVNGSKNAALPALAASLLTAETLRLTNIPDLLDVRNVLDILSSLGVDVVRNDDSVQLTAKNTSTSAVVTEKVALLRGSILLLGALVARHGNVALPLPGGDLIGARPIDVHLDGFRQLGARVALADGQVRIDGSAVCAGRVVLKEFSVTATENMLLLASTLPGSTTIEIAATEPHVVALCELLTRMGARIEGAGTHTITVQGATTLHGASFGNIPDMLEAGTFILLAAATQSTLQVTAVPTADLALFFRKLEEIGIHYRIEGDTVTVQPSTLAHFSLKVLPHPGIATDLQAPFAVVATQAQGSSLIHDPLYEGRFRHVSELKKMGATVTLCDPHRVIIEGPTALTGQRIPSLDVRSGASLLVAGLVATGETIIDNAEIVERGYAALPERLTAIGADITRVV